MKAHELLSEVVRDVPEAEKEAAAERFLRYLEIVIAIADEAEAREREENGGLTDETEPPTLSYSV